jgi:hypothetical protein
MLELMTVAAVAVLVAAPASCFLERSDRNHGLAALAAPRRWEVLSPPPGIGAATCGPQRLVGYGRVSPFRPLRENV